MGRLDSLLSFTFMRAPDGRGLFFPFGSVTRGYVIGSQLDYDRLRRRTKIGLIVAFVLVAIGRLAIAWLALPRHVFDLVVVAVAVAMVAYMQYLLRGLASPAERLSRQATVTFQARGRSLASLMWPMIGSIAFVALCVILLAINPTANRLVAMEGILFFGFCAVILTSMLIARRRSLRSIDGPRP
jgi:hypothetical protein